MHRPTSTELWGQVRPSSGAISTRERPDSGRRSPGSGLCWAIVVPMSPTQGKFHGSAALKRLLFHTFDRGSN